jgi:hypothetical protein
VGGNPYAGRAYLYSGATGVLLRTVRSPQYLNSSDFSARVAGVPDVNGDGRGDLVASSRELSGGKWAGHVHLLSGATGAWLRTLSSPVNPTGDADFAQLAVVGLGDVNGDGRGDVAASGTAPPGAPAGTGRVFVYSGATGALLRNLSSPAQQVGGNFGGAIGAVPDITGDGRPEIVVGADGEKVGQFPKAGRVYIFNGATGALIRTLPTINPQFGGFGVSVAGVPDVNGDGKGDILVGAPFHYVGAKDNAGRAYLFSGADGSTLKVLYPGKPVLGGFFGFAVAPAPDLTGDGKADLAISAPGMERVFVYSGANGAFVKTLASPGNGNKTGFGVALAGIADVSGNGRGEVLIGSPAENSPGGDLAGRAFLFRN